MNKKGNIFDKIYEKYFKERVENNNYFNVVHQLFLVALLFPILLIKYGFNGVSILVLLITIPSIVQLLSINYRKQLISDFKNSMPDFSFGTFVAFIIAISPFLFIIYTILTGD